MKTLLLTLLVTLTTTSAFACSCMSPEFSDNDTENAIVNFMKNKHGIEREDIIEIDSYDHKGFLDPVSKVFAFIAKRVSSPDMYACELGCAQGMNEKAKHVVAYQVDGKICEMKLKTKMKSALGLNSSGFTSLVKQKLKPTCL